MAVLIIDNSSNVLRIAVSSKQMYSEYNIFEKKCKSDFIISDLSKLMSSAGLDASEISKIGYINSGLSFTGIRVGLCLALAIATINNSTLVALDPFVCILIQYLTDHNISLNNQYVVIIAPSYGYRTNCAIIKLDGFINVQKYNIDLTESINITLPDDYINDEKLLVLNTLPTTYYHHFITNCSFHHQHNFVDKHVVCANNFELTTINQALIDDFFPNTEILSADVYY
jgi:hypothetical protein